MAAFLLAIVLVAPSVAAPGPGDLDASIATVQDITPKTAPVRYSLGQLKFSVQTLNNCGPASVVSAMSYYGINVSQEEARKVLRPGSESRGMSANGFPGYVAKFGLEARVYTDGNIDVIKTLIANDIPVIVGQWVSESSHIGHYRVVQGYDDAKGVFYVNDSLLGPNVVIPYASFEARWNYRRGQYTPVYQPDTAALVTAIVGPNARPDSRFGSRNSFWGP